MSVAIACSIILFPNLWELRDLLRDGGLLLRLRTHVFSNHLDQASLIGLAKLIVMSGLLAHNNSAAAITRIKPLAAGRDLAAGAIDAHSRPHLHKWPSLPKRGRFLVLHPD